MPLSYLRFIRRDIANLRRGANVALPNGNQIHVKGCVICGTCDQPAKANFLNMTQFNGTWGCQVCKIQSVRLDPDNPRNPKRIYPFQINLELRSDVEHRQFAVNAFRTGRKIFGVKGLSSLATFIPNPVESTAVDIMHQCYLGLTKDLIKLWFDPEFTGNPSTIYGYVGIVDQRLKAASPPGFIQRHVRSIADHYKFWKAKEFKLWLLVYSLPFVEGILHERFFEHHKLLVFGISVLNMDTVSPRMVELASRAFTNYVSMFSDLYGRSYMSSNLHLLLHLPLTVQRFGPLWTTSCFPYESLNGVLKKFVSGTRYADLQVYTAASMFLNLTAYRTEKLVPGRPAHSFCERLSNYQRRLALTHISDRLAAVGKERHTDNLPEEVERALIDENLGNVNYFRFYRLFDKKRNMVFSSSCYVRGETRDSSWVKYLREGREKFGVVHSYLHVVQCNCERACGGCDHTYYAVIRECTVRPAYRAPVIADPGVGVRAGMAGGVLPLIYKIPGYYDYFAVEVHNLLCVCHFVEIQDENTKFIVEPLNSKEVE